MHYIRDIEAPLLNWMFKGKIVVLYGPRQVGKTTLTKKILSDNGCQDYYFDCEWPQVQENFKSLNQTLYARLLNNAKVIVLDEAQRIPNIGTVLKLLHDHFPNTQVIATGSSSFELANLSQEALTGRSLTFTLYPLSQQEMLASNRFDQLQENLQQCLITGQYPEIHNSSDAHKILLLKDLAEKYLYKDVLSYEHFKKPEALTKLMQCLAFQIGSEVSIHELAQQCQVHARTIERYIDILEKAFVIKRLKPYSNNLRKEITKKHKFYFIDLGMRNALISQMNPINLRQDVGALWENFFVIERLKYLSNKGTPPEAYFWRTHSGQEIDYLEIKNHEITAYEVKWSSKKTPKVPTQFAKQYPEAAFHSVNPETIWNHILSK